MIEDIEKSANLRIQNLNDKKDKHQVIYRHENSILNSDGNIENVEKFVVAKETTKEGFIKLFVDNLYYLVNLDNIEKTLFFIILSKMDYKNIIFFDRSLRKAIIDSKLIGKTSLYRAFNGLVEKSVVIKVSKESILQESMLVSSDEAYIVNPNLVGKGSFRDLRQLRHTVITDYDFENLEVKKQFISQEKYIGFDEVAQNLDKHEIKEINKNEEEKTIELIVGEKDIEEKNENREHFKENLEESEYQCRIAEIELEEAKLKVKKSFVLKFKKEIL